ncbi:site-specific integrase [Telmatospirillum sp.]|uniref:site-specific integrase n=1 Tax=Telmatospirillum sp. TaxID=2079197 RepID=UPI002845BC85|nr:site-specific integrase [Telmatospirillum sp.]MDR3436041.1 site-specific integrase [Telmatospirillum sp.]
MATIRKHANGWEVQIRKKGYKPVCKRFDTKAKADKFASIAEGEMDKGVYVDRTEAENTTLKEALERYEREVTPGKKGARQEKLRLAAWGRDGLASRSLASIRGADMAEWRDKRLASGTSPTTVRNDLAVISHLFSIAMREWGMESLSNPIDKIRVPAAARARDRRLSPDLEEVVVDGKTLTLTEEQRLLNACSARKPWLAPLVRLALATAMRQGELIGLEWKNVDLERKVAKLLDTKNGEARDVPLSTEAVKALENLSPAIDGIVPLRAGPVFATDTDQVVYEFRQACKKAGIVGLRFHDLRHEATSRLFEKGLNPMEAASVTGHKTLQMLKRYTHLRAEDLAKKLG